MAGKTEKQPVENPWDVSAEIYAPGHAYLDKLNQLASNMSPAAVVRRRLFAAHYIKSTDAKAAAKFAGFSTELYGPKLLKEPYVQHLLRDLLNQLDQDAIMSQNEVLFRFKEEAIGREDSSANTRVAALSNIAKIHGMMVERQETTIRSSGVMVVPAMPGADEWGEAAEKSQSALKNSVRD